MPEIPDLEAIRGFFNARIPGAAHIPMGQIPTRISEIPQDRPIVVYCATGQRSGVVTEALRQAGHPQVFNVAGGIVAWMNEQLPVESGPPQTS